MLKTSDYEVFILEFGWALEQPGNGAFFYDEGDETGYPEEVWMLHPWKCSRCGWMRLGTTWSSRSFSKEKEKHLFPKLCGWKFLDIIIFVYRALRRNILDQRLIFSCVIKFGAEGRAYRTRDVQLLGFRRCLGKVRNPPHLLGTKDPTWRILRV